MGYSVGIIVGGTLACILLGLLAGVAFKEKDPDERAIYAALIAWIVSGVLAGFGMADGGPFRFAAIAYYIPGAIMALLYLRWHYPKSWQDEEWAKKAP